MPQQYTFIAVRHYFSSVRIIIISYAITLQRQTFLLFIMKNVVISLLVLFVIGLQNVFAYDSYVIDTARISIYYRYECLKDTVRPIRKQDVAVLQIGKRYTAFFSPYTIESYVSDNKVSYKSTVITQAPEASVIKYFLYKDIKSNSIEHIDNVAYRYWKYEERQPSFNWTMSEETMEIGGYNCQKAECDYGGRHWIAWFAPEIPLNYGPYKFNGLPGLIMKIEDTSRHYIFEFAFIDNEPAQILKIKFKTETVTKKHLFTELHKFMINLIKYTDLVYGTDNSQIYVSDLKVDPLERDAEFMNE